MSKSKTEFNYCLIKNNKFYEDLYDVLEETELNMQRRDDAERIKDEIKKLVNTNKNIIISEVYEDTEKLLEEILLQITKDDTSSTLQGDTILLYADEKVMYESMYMEDLRRVESDDNINQLVTISNIELKPIYNICGIIKTDYKTGELIKRKIFKKDIIDIMIYNFYHTGVLLNTDNSYQEIEFTGDNPNLVLGGMFKQRTPIEIYGLSFVIYEEDCNSGVGQINERISKLLEREVRGRIFVSILCPITNKKFCNITNNTLEDIINIKNNKDRNDRLEKELGEDKIKNPFYLIKKYCIL